ncbi:MAG TPA: hypothetical protein VGM03_02230, partial [Phycisphaerae bacterium]
VITTLLVNAGRARYMWITVVPMCWVLITTTTGGITQIVLQFWPMATGPGAKPGDVLKGWMNIGLIGVMIACAAVIVAQCAGRWLAALRVPPSVRVPGVID